MKVVKIILGGLAALWALGCLTEILVKTIPNAGGPLFVSQLMGGLAGVALGSALSIACFKSAFKKPGDTKNNTSGSSPNLPRSNG